MAEITAAQTRAACAMLNWSMMDLAQAASVPVATVRQAEQDGGEAVATSSSDALRAALETAGIRFLDDDGAGAGLRLGPR